MNNQPIGILDSGFGGLSIWLEVAKQLPHESIIYVGDSKNCPYGTKTPGEVIGLTRRLIRFLLSKNVTLIVIACNTATVCALDVMRKEFPQVPLIGIVPVIKTAAEKSKTKRIGVLSTSATAKSAYQRQLIELYANDCEVVTVGTDALVPLIEAGHRSGDMLKKELLAATKEFSQQKIDVIALGCSHFPLIKEAIQEVVGPDVLLLDSAGAVARQIARILTQNNARAEKQKPDYSFVTSGDRAQFGIIAKTLVHPSHADLFADVQILEEV